MTYDKFDQLNSINQDSLIDLLDKNDFRHIQDLYYSLLNDFEPEELTSDQRLFIEDIDDLYDYWQQKDDFRYHFLPKLSVPISLNEEIDHLIDHSGLFG